MTPLAQAISGALLQFIWQGFVVGVLAGTLGLLLRRSQPNIRYLLYCAALCVLTALPVITAMAIYDPLAGTMPARHPAMTLTIRAVWNGSVSSLAVATGKWLSASQPGVLRVWISGVAFLSLRLAWLAARVRSLRRAGVPADRGLMAVAAAVARRMGVTRAVRVLVSSIPGISGGPGVAGWFRPVILLPAAAILNLTPDQLEAILAHELAHLRRYDDVVNIAQSVIETLLFYHPAVWWVSNRIRHERELCCDDLAVRASAGPICYARALTALEALRVSAPHLTLGATGTGASPLEHRIRRIVGLSAPRDMPSALPGVLAFALTLASVAVYSIPASGSAPVPDLQPLPAYPESARLNGIQGTVPVEVRIDRVGHVSGAKAIGGPAELRQAAIRSAAALQFAPETVAGTEQVDVAFELAASAPPPAQAAAPDPPSARNGPRWRDRSESAIGLAVNTEKDPSKLLDLLAQWEQLYPDSEFRAQRAFMTAQALLGIVGAAYGKTDPAILDAGKKAAEQLAEHFGEYLDDSVKPDGLSPEEWALVRKTSELQIHTILAYVAQTNNDDGTAEVELTKVLALDPEQADASYQLGEIILRRIATDHNGFRYPEAIYDFARSLAVTGPSALLPEARAAAEDALSRNYTAWHGSQDGMKDLVTRAADSALAPDWFTIARAPRDPDPDAGNQEVTVSVVSQVSSGKIFVRIGNDDAILRFDNAGNTAYRPGAILRFTGTPDSCPQDPCIRTFIVRNPKQDIVVLNAGKSGRRTLLVRVFKTLSRLVRHLA